MNLSDWNYNILITGRDKEMCLNCIRSFATAASSYFFLLFASQLSVYVNIFKYNIIYNKFVESLTNASVKKYIIEKLFKVVRVQLIRVNLKIVNSETLDKFDVVLLSLSPY